MRIVPLLAGGFLAGCFFTDPAAGPDEEPRSTSTGRVCVLATNDPASDALEQSFAVGQPVHVLYIADDCLSGCASGVVASVEVTAFGPLGFDVEGYAEWTEPDPSAELACPAVCVVAAADLPTPALDAGDYVFRFNGQTLNLTVPSVTEGAPCVSAE